MPDKCYVEGCEGLEEVEVNPEGELTIYREKKGGIGEGNSRNSRAQGDIISIGKGFRPVGTGLCYYHNLVLRRELTPVFLNTYKKTQMAHRRFLQRKGKS